MGPGRPSFAACTASELVRGAASVFTAVWSLQVYGTVDNHPILAWIYVPLLLLTTFRVTAVSLVFTTLLLADELANCPLPAHDIGLAVQTALLTVWSWRGMLLRGKCGGPAGGHFLRAVWTVARPCLFTLAAALGLSVCFRGAPVLECALWCVSVLSVACAIPPPRPFAWRDAATATLLTAVSSALALVVLEVGARMAITGAAPTAQVAVYDPDTWWALGANASGDFQFPNSPLDSERTFGVFSVQTSSQGFRDRAFGPKQPGEYRILLLGDSFAYGWGVNEDDMISRRLEARLNTPGAREKFTAINGGVEGYGPWQERIRLNKLGFALQPDVVILQLFPANDIDNQLGKIGKHMAAYSRLWSQTLDTRRYWGTWQVRAHEWCKRHSAAYRAIAQATNRPGLLIEILDSIRFIKPSRIGFAKPSDDRPYWLEVQLKDWYPDLEEGLAMMRRDILAMRDDCRAHGAEFVVFTTADINSVCDASWDWNMRYVKDPAIYERGRDVSALQNVYEQDRLDYIDLPAAMKRAPDPCALYYGNDGHLTPAGTDFTAQVIADYLADRGLPAHRQDAAPAR